jgi:hypothetical protein
MQKEEGRNLHNNLPPEIDVLTGQEYKEIAP